MYYKTLNQKYVEVQSVLHVLTDYETSLNNPRIILLNDSYPFQIDLLTLLKTEILPIVLMPAHTIKKAV